MYEAYWKLLEKPFENTPNPRFLYYSQKHEEALSRMLYAIREKKGGVILTGEYGSGKTLLSRVLLEEVSLEYYQSVLIVNPKLPNLDLLEEIIRQLNGGRKHFSSKADLLNHFNEILLRNRKDAKRTIIILDEAQSIQEEDGFEELRLLLNFQLPDDFLFTLILLGQPELKEKISKLPQLKQRLAIRYHLKALTESETREYIIHRLEVAGSKEEVFTYNALNDVYRFSGGIPRRINNICDMALLVSYSKKLNKIDEAIIRDVALDLEETSIGVDDSVRVIPND